MVAPAGNLATQAARNDLYQDQVNEGILMRPGIHLTRSLVYADSAGVDGGATGIARLISGASLRLRKVQNGYARSLRPHHARRRRRHPRCPVGDAVMTSFPWLTLLGLVPLLGAVAVWLLPAGLAARAKHVALGFSLSPSSSASSRPSPTRAGRDRAVPAQRAAPVDPAVRRQLRARRRRHRPRPDPHVAGAHPHLPARRLGATSATARRRTRGRRATSRSCSSSRRSWWGCSPQPTSSSSTSSSRPCSSRSTSSSASTAAPVASTPR